MKTKMRRMEIEPAETGGHIVTHFPKEQPQHSGKMGVHMGYLEPQRHIFSAAQGPEMMKHIASHLGVGKQEAPEAESKAEVDVE